MIPYATPAARPPARRHFGLSQVVIAMAVLNAGMVAADSFALAVLAFALDAAAASIGSVTLLVVWAVRPGAVHGLTVALYFLIMAGMAGIAFYFVVATAPKD